MARVPKYSLHKASGQGVARIAGKDHYFGPFDDPASQAKYHRAVQEYLLSGQSPTFNAPAKGYSMAGVSVAYLHFAKTYYSGSSE
jgi:hypothetical protein